MCSQRRTTCVKDTAEYENDAMVIFGAGPIGRMAGVFSLQGGARKVIFIDIERLSQTKSCFSSVDQAKVELFDFKKLPFGVAKQRDGGEQAEGVV